MRRILPVPVSSGGVHSEYASSILVDGAEYLYTRLCRLREKSAHFVSIDGTLLQFEASSDFIHVVELNLFRPGLKSSNDGVPESDRAAEAEGHIFKR